MTLLFSTEKHEYSSLHQLTSTACVHTRILTIPLFNTAGGNMGPTLLHPMSQEPLLAARMLIEECQGLLLDVDDIDRCFKASGAQPALAGSLLHAR